MRLRSKQYRDRQGAGARSLALAVLFVVICSAKAFADEPDKVQIAEPPPRPARPNVVRDSIALDASMWSSERYGINWPIVAVVQHRLAALPVGALVGSVAVPFAVESGSDRSSSEGGSAWGNPTATLTYAMTTRNVTPFIGARIAAPIASNGDERADLIVERAGAANAYYDYDLWSVGYLPLAIPFGVEVQPVRSLWLRGAFAPELYVAIEGWAETRGSLQAELEVEGRAANGAGGGITFRAVGNGVFRSARDDPDSTQTAIEPYFVYDGIVLVRTGFMLALDPPLGFGKRSDIGVVALHVTLGVRLDALAASHQARTASR